MEPKSYRYSLYNCLGWILNCFLYGYLISRAFRHGFTLTPFWICFAAFAAILWIYRFFEQVILYLVPLILGKAALELDDEGLSYRNKSRIIHWADINEIKPSTMVTTIKLFLANNKKIKINMNVIKGDDARIHQDIVAFFEKSKTQPKPI